MKKNWILNKNQTQSKRKFEELEFATEKILINRGVNTKKKVESFFMPDYEKDLHNPFLLQDMEKAVKRFLEAAAGKQKVCIYGDYDADGITSSALLHLFFDEMNVDNFCYIPDRDKEGYGINKNAIDYIKGKEADLIITVDCGVTNVEEVEYAKQKGIDVIVLDHHHVPEDIPDSAAVVDPKRKDSKYPFSELAGVGVTFKFMQAAAERIEK
ncbi:MAG: DHH family phosphoesterase, partial [Candidatus Moraniibacteriota bacterium]